MKFCLRLGIKAGLALFFFAPCLAFAATVAIGDFLQTPNPAMFQEFLALGPADSIEFFRGETSPSLTNEEFFYRMLAVEIPNADHGREAKVKFIEKFIALFPQIQFGPNLSDYSNPYKAIESYINDFYIFRSNAVLREAGKRNAISLLPLQALLWYAEDRPSFDIARTILNIDGVIHEFCDQRDVYPAPWIRAKNESLRKDFQWVLGKGGRASVSPAMIAKLPDNMRRNLLEGAAPLDINQIFINQLTAFTERKLHSLDTFIEAVNLRTQKLSKPLEDAAHISEHKIEVLEEIVLELFQRTTPTDGRPNNSIVKFSALEAVQALAGYLSEIDSKTGYFFLGLMNTKFTSQVEKDATLKPTLSTVKWHLERVSQKEEFRSLSLGKKIALKCRIRWWLL